MKINDGNKKPKVNLYLLYKYIVHYDIFAILCYIFCTFDLPITVSQKSQLKFC